MERGGARGSHATAATTYTAHDDSPRLPPTLPSLPSQLAGKSIADKRYRILVNTYERALVHLHKMPRIWLDYCAVLAKLKRGTLTRRTFDRALQALPITQHDRVWNLYLEWYVQRPLQPHCSYC